MVWSLAMIYRVGVLQGHFLIRGFLGLSVPSCTLHNRVASEVTPLTGILGGLRPYHFSAIPPLSSPHPRGCHPAPFLRFPTLKLDTNQIQWPQLPSFLQLPHILPQILLVF